MKKQEYNLQPTFIARAGEVAFTTTVPQALGKDFNGRKIVVAGTIIPANDATAEGILANDVDVTEGDAVGAKIVEAYIYKSRLPVTPTEEAIAALKEIKFIEYEG